MKTIKEILISKRLLNLCFFIFINFLVVEGQSTKPQQGKNINDSITIVLENNNITELDKIDTSIEKVLTVAEEMPEFPGGVEEMSKYLRDNLSYSMFDKYGDFSGTIYVTFIVDKYGFIKNIKVLRGAGEESDKEVVKMIKNMPRWKAGKQNGVPVAVRYNLPIKIHLK